METESPRSKVEAIYQLREAVEAKARAELQLELHGSPSARDQLLAAQIDVEAKTQEAIDVCHECGHPVGDGHAHAQHPAIAADADNVIYVDFRRESGNGS